MRITLVTETFRPEVNGVAMTLGRLVDGLRERGHVVEVVRPRQAHEAADAAVPECEWVVPGMPIPFYRSLRMGLPVTRRLRRRWQSARPDVVHVATEGPLGVAALRAARSLGLPVTSSYHTNFHQYGAHYGIGLGRSLALWWMRRFHNATRRTLVPTRQMVDELAAEGFERLGVLSRGVDTTLFSPDRRDDALRAQWGAAPEDVVVLYVGRMAAEKNIGLVVAAFEGIRARVPSAKLVLVGDGPARATIEAAHPDFHYAGMRRGEELAAHYASADLFLFASVTETFGNVVTEAMASGLVVLGYDYAAPREHVREAENGYLVPFDDAERFKARAVEVVTRRADWPEVRAAAARTMRGCTWAAIIDGFAGVLGDAANENAGA
ncbi:glycosyltransferase family 4 protein [Actomonas aquatica]|uniref:Glycosyltransferase family 1 protein n=1 Tax=Actomonas aquatica TaxID=2866162 RepID=A0ABZ1CAL7_9BACT|nr:glycosyltransferase family 1 protein [Opitutus sp. WL0086]WRQ88548.1 glycosyltransferase family 1 protein [Opitutus sp. WL0086]